MSRRLFLAGLLLGAVLRAVALPLPGTGDVMVWKIWAHAASRDGVTGMYGVGGQPVERRLHAYDGRFATVDYPPLALAELGAAGRAYRALTGGFANTPALTAAVKLLPVAAEVGITWLLIAAVSRAAPARPDLARLAGLAYWLNPAALLNASALGYLDPLFALPALAALLAAHAGRSAWAGALIAAATLTKPQAALFVVPVALAAWNGPRSGGWRALVRAGAAGAAVTGAAVLPFAAAGAWPNLWQAMGSLARHNMLSANAANVWWIVTYVMRGAYAVADLGWVDAFFLPVKRPLMISTFVELGYPNPRMFGALLVVAAAAWGIWRCRAARDLPGLAVAGGWVVFSYFMLGIAVHENHGYMLVPLVVLAAALRPSWRRLALLLSLSMAANLNVFYGLDGARFALPRRMTGLDLSVWLAAGHVAVYAAYARRMIRETRPPTSGP